MQVSLYKYYVLCKIKNAKHSGAVWQIPWGGGGALPHLAQTVGATIRKGWKVSRILSLKQCIQFHYLASFQGVLWGFVIVFLFWPTEVSAITLTKWR